MTSCFPVPQVHPQVHPQVNPQVHPQVHPPLIAITRRPQNPPAQQRAQLARKLVMDAVNTRAGIEFIATPRRMFRWRFVLVYCHFTQDSRFIHFVFWNIDTKEIVTDTDFKDWFHYWNVIGGRSGTNRCSSAKDSSRLMVSTIGVYLKNLLPDYTRGIDLKKGIDEGQLNAIQAWVSHWSACQSPSPLWVLDVQALILRDPHITSRTRATTGDGRAACLCCMNLDSAMLRHQVYERWPSQPKPVKAKPVTRKRKRKSIE